MMTVINAITITFSYAQANENKPPHRGATIAELNRERSETNLNVLLCSPGGTDGLLVLWNMARKTVEVNISRRGTRNADV